MLRGSGGKPRRSWQGLITANSNSNFHISLFDLSSAMCKSNHVDIFSVSPLLVLIYIAHRLMVVAFDCIEPGYRTES